MKFKVISKATSIHITPGEEALELLQPIIKLLEYEDEMTDEIVALGYMLDNDTNTLYLHKGVDLKYLSKLLINVEFVSDPYDDYSNINFDYEEIVPPRNEDQVDVINFIAGQKQHSSNINDRQLFLVKTMGFGKTFCASVGICEFDAKTLIITHRESLRGQWVNSLYKMTGFSKKDVHEITSSDEIYNIVYGNISMNCDVYLMTHSTFRAGLKRLNAFSDMRYLTKNLGIGMKIIDEAHLEFRNTLLMDFLFNVSRNLYLTATDGRSSKEENSIFKYVFSNATFYRKMNTVSSTQPSKWVNYVRIELNSHCPSNVYRYRVNGGRGMSAITYGKWVIANDKKQTHFKCCRDILRMIFENDAEAKVIVFMPLIDLCDDAAYFFRMQLNYDDSFEFDLNIKTINSHNSKNDNERNKHADVIVTTIASCGTGTDIHGITDIISCSPLVSKITAAQVFGRIRYCGKICHYYDIWDSSVPMDKIWMKSRSKKFIELALNSNEQLAWFDDSTPTVE